MFWADQIAKDIKGKTKGKSQWVDDMKTPSGRIHVGSLRGVILHDLIYKALLDLDVKAHFSYMIQEYDPMDGISPQLEALGYKKYMGIPLFKIPAPEKRFKNLGHYYASEFIEVFNGLGAHPEILWESELLQSGKMNGVIKECLDGAPKIRKIYKKVAGSDKGNDWYPFQVICEKCGKIGTTKVYDWDGKKVSYRCEEKMVAWAQGCGHEGKISPFDGNGKLPWKVDWAALWKMIGITVEAAGKDHMSEGGSHDIADAICKQVLNYSTPYGFLYEFLIIGGKKMSSSKGVGSSAKEVADILPPELLRFLMTRPSYRKAIDFDPQGMTIPDLFDEYDRCADLFWKEGKENDHGRAWELSQIDQVSEKYYLPRFLDVAKYLQMPKVGVQQKFEEDKGSKLNKLEKEELEKRIEYAQIWIENYAPDDWRYQVTSELPKETVDLSEKQKEFLGQAAKVLKEKDWKPEELQNALYQAGKELSLKPKETFQAIYVSLLGKDHGPKAAWLILDQDQKLVVNRFQEASQAEQKEEQTKEELLPNISDPTLISIDPQLLKKYPSIISGFAIIKGVSIKKKSDEFEQFKKEYLSKLSQFTRDSINQSISIQSYRKLYKAMGVDWHKKMNSPEALRRRLVKGQDLPQINVCVDAYNLAVVKHGVSCGAFDFDQIKFPVVIKEAQGGEKALYIGDKEETVIQSGEICYFDQIGPYNLDFNYRDAIRTLATEKTQNLWINVEGVYDISRRQVEEVLQESVDLIIRFCGGKLEKIGIIK